MKLNLELEGLGERRDFSLFGSLLHSWKVEFRPNIWSIIILEYLIFIISDKFMRGLLQRNRQH